MSSSLYCDNDCQMTLQLSLSVIDSDEKNKRQTLEQQHYIETNAVKSFSTHTITKIKGKIRIIGFLCVKGSEYSQRNSLKL